MREILFRGQTRRCGEKVRIGDGQKLPSRWVYGGVLQGTGDRSIIYGSENENKPSEGLEKWVVYADTLGQYTGLTDKNGKKIFEGDIVQYYGTYALEVFIENGHTKIRWFDTVMNGEYDELFFGFDEALGECEVIGNIHDNPELLEAK